MKNKRSFQQAGFALVASLSILSLMIMIAIVMVSLATTQQKSSKFDLYYEAARANARFALAEAVAILQEEMGPDQRISANANILANDSSGRAPDVSDFDATSIDSNFKNPYYLGVWDSIDTWLNDSSVADTYVRGRHDADGDGNGKFRRWLVSGSGDYADIDYAETTDNSGTVNLVGAQTVGNAGESKYVYAPEVSLYDDKAKKLGSYAWWIGGSNQKANLAHITEYSASTPTHGENIQTLNTQPFSGLNWVDDNLSAYPENDQAVLKSITYQTAELLSDSDSDTHNAYIQALRNRYHDFTTYNPSIIANVRNGGLKKDLNLLFEKSRLPAEYGTFGYKRDHYDYYDSGSIVPIRPYSDELPSTTYGTKTENFSSWYKLHQYYLVALNRTEYGLSVWFNSQDPQGGQTQTGTYFNGDIPISDMESFHHSTWYKGNLSEVGWSRTPLISRLVVNISLRRVRNSSGLYDHYINYTPYVVLWNPYNITLRCQPSWLDLESGGLETKIWKNGSLIEDWSLVHNPDRILSEANFITRLHIQDERGWAGKYPMVLKPGETRIYSVIGDTARTGTSVIAMEVLPGYIPPTAGGGIDLRIPGGENFSETDKFQLALRAGDQQTQHAGDFQFYMTLRSEPAGNAVRYNEIAGCPVQIGVPMTIVSEDERLEIAGEETILPFASFEHTLKSGEDLRNPAPYDQLDKRVKGFVHAKPWNHRSMYGQASDRIKAMTQLDYHVTNGGGNQLNPTYDAQYRSLLGSAVTPSSIYQGQYVAPLTELLIAPPTSLSAFLHFKGNPGETRDFRTGRHLWDISTNDAHVIGSSFANPMIPADNVYYDAPDAASIRPDQTFDGRGGYYDQMHLIRDHHDHTFLLNDALWDEWFCSSITTRTADLFGTAKTVKETAQQFFDGSGSLASSSYVINTTVADADKIVAELFDSSGEPTDIAHKKVASYMKNNVGFNVNSTSVDAWVAMLSGMKDKYLSYIDVDTGELQTYPSSSTSASDVSDFENKVKFTRFAVPNGYEEGTDAGDPNSWRGIRLLDQTQIEKLAKECVRQVKLRGPFLNMADFVNRRLTGDADQKEMAVCGAIQAAIDWDEFNGHTPSSTATDSVNARYKDTAMEDMILESQFDSWPTKFPHQEAALGSRWTGIPGYLVQADVLKRIANHVTVRDDSFVIRAYGSAGGSNNEPLVEVWLEATVTRSVAYSDTANSAETAFTDLNDTNQTYGRKMKITSMKWLSRQEL